MSPEETQEITVTLTRDELQYLRSCVADSECEDNFDPGFEGLDLDEIEESLRRKGVLEAQQP
jgi:hypothetical protein